MTATGEVASTEIFRRGNTSTPTHIPGPNFLNYPLILIKLCSKTTGKTMEYSIPIGNIHRTHVVFWGLFDPYLIPRRWSQNVPSLLNGTNGIRNWSL